MGLLAVPAGIALLVLGANWLVQGSAQLARKFGTSDLIVGLTIVAFGTSLPEFTMGVVASLDGESEIVFGGVIGSNMANILLILGVSSLIHPLRAQPSTVYLETPFVLLSALVVLVISSDSFLDQRAAIVTRSDGLVLIGFFFVFLYYVFTGHHSHSHEQAPVSSPGSALRMILLVVAGVLALTWGGKLSVSGAVDLARFAGVSERVIGLTILAIGTSLPELITSVVAALRRSSDIAMGNIIGSNLFNTFWILGVSSVIHPIPVIGSQIPDLWVNVASSLLLFLSFVIGRRNILEGWQGAGLLFVYAGYMTVQVMTPG